MGIGMKFPLEFENFDLEILRCRDIEIEDLGIQVLGKLGSKGNGEFEEPETNPENSGLPIEPYISTIIKNPKLVLMFSMADRK